MRAIFSAATGEQSESQVPTAGCPLRSLSVTGLVLMLLMPMPRMMILLDVESGYGFETFSVLWRTVLCSITSLVASY
jgi:hypothetical protein